MTSYLAVTLRQPRRYKFWLGRRAVDGSIALVAEFANEHELRNIVLKLNGQTVPEPAMDKEQPQQVNFRTFKGEPHPDSVRAHNQRWSTDGTLRKPNGPDQPAPDAKAVGHPAAPEPEVRDADDGGRSPAD